MKLLIPHSKPFLGEEEKRACCEVIESGQIAQGPRVEKFEKRFSEFLGMPQGVATSSGTTALHLALLALGVGKNDEVIMPSYVCSALLNATCATGAIPRIADIEPDYFNMDPEQVRKNLTPKTKAIIVPHLFGFPADMDRLLTFGVPIIEDCAQTIGARWRGKLIGTLAEVSIFSFYATKVMTTSEGGMVLSKSKKLIEKIRDLRDYDYKKTYKPRFNYKMTDLQAAMGIVQLEKLPFFIQRRREISSSYHNEFSNLKLGLPLTKSNPQAEPIFYRYILPIKKNRKIFEKNLYQRGIACTPPVDKPLHRYLKLSPTNYKVTEEVFKTALSIPIYPALTENEVQKIITAVKKELVKME